MSVVGTMMLEGGAGVVGLVVLLLYTLIGYGMVSAAHDENPAARGRPWVYQFFGVVLWAPIAFGHWRRGKRHRARWPRT